MAQRQYPSLVKYYNQEEKYLFLGNGLNRVDQMVSWGDLLKLVCQELEITIDSIGKPYPLFFEQISFDLNPEEKVEDNIKTLKEKLGTLALRLQPHALLKQIVNSGYYAHYLTTNYDYCIERALEPLFDPVKGKNKMRPKYSLDRYNKVGKSKVWHIHGECNNGYTGTLSNFPEASILIGFEHYTDYLEKIHHLLKDNSGKGLGYLMDHAKENWVHLFFTRDIDILGFGFDFTETHLWFILNFRARLIRSKASLLNKIRFIIPGFSANQGKIEILRSLGIEVVEVHAAQGDYAAFFQKFTESIV